MLVGFVGNAIGGAISGKIVPKFGVWKTMIFCNFCSLIANGMRLAMSTPTLMIGRFIFGFMVAF